MKYNISAKALKAYNNGKKPGFNENWNLQNGTPSMAEYQFLRMVEKQLFGVFKRTRKLTKKDIDSFYPYYESEIQFAKRFEIQGGAQ